MPSLSKRIHLLTFAAYLLLALGLTYPVITNPARLVPGSDTWAYDEYTFLWNIWWFKHSLLDLGSNPLYTGYTFYPLGAPLVLYTYNFFYCALGLPLYLVSNLPFASNLTLWLGLALSGYTAYFLARYLLIRRFSQPDGAGVQLAAFLTGLAYAFPASRFVYLALGHYMLAAVGMLPLFVLFLLRALDERRRWHLYAILAGLALTLSALAEMTFALFLGLLLLVFALAAWRRLSGLALLARLGVVIAVAALTYSPLLYYILREAILGGYALEGWGDSLRLSVDLVGLLAPTALHPLWGTDWAGHLREAASGIARFSDVHTFFLGYAVLTLAVGGLIVQGRRALPWAATAFLAVVLSLGPLLQINGRYLFDLDGLQTTFPLPFILLHYIPLANAGRTPNRFSVLAVLALAPLVGLGCYWLLGRLRRWYLAAAVATVLALALLWDGLSMPLPTTDASVPPFYAQLAEDKEDYAILSLPFGLRSSFGTRGAERTQLQYYQAVHGKRILGGNVSRAPAMLFQYYEQVAPLAHLLAVESYRQPADLDWEREHQEAAALAALLDIRYLVVHAPVPGRLPYADTYEEAISYAAQVFALTEVYRDPAGKLVAYRVQQAAIPSQLTIDLGSGSGNMYLGAGWSGEESIAGASARWIEGQRATLYLPVDEPGERVLTFNAIPFTFPGAADQVVSVLVNGRETARFQMAPSWQQYSLSIPANSLHHGANTVQLRLAYARRPADVSPESYAIGTTGQRAPTHLEVHSNKDIAYITVGTADGSRHADGLNVAVFDARKGALLASEVFSWQDADRLGRFLALSGQGQGIILASQGGVPGGLDPRLCAVLASVGASGCPPTGVAGYALIGFAGAAPGSALEASGEDAYLRLSPDRRALSAAVDWLRYERLP